MRSELARLLARNKGVLTRTDTDKPWMLTNATRAGKVVRLFPGVFVDAARKRDEDVRRHAALRYVVGRGALSRNYFLDVYAERERVNFELDGAAFHGDSVMRERDLRRDAALAALGIMVVRFTYDRLMTEPEAVRREVFAIIAARRRSL